MKICMVGLGSIGKRHIKNVSRLLKERKVEYTIDALRSSERKLPEEINELLNQEYFSYDGLPEDYDVIFITNPTSEHYTAIEKLSKKARAMFIEKPLFSQSGIKIPELPPTGIYYVACPLRHQAVIQYVKEELDKGEAVFAARAISSSYLPEWRKGVDYRTTYSANRKLGGGVTLDLIHEWDYLTYLFGMPKKLMHLEGHYSDLEMDCEDASLYMADYGNVTIEVHLDYYGRFTERRLELYCKEYRMDVDLIQNTVAYKSMDPDKNRLITFPQEDIHLNEINYFLDLLEGKKENMNTVAHAKDVLDLVLQK
ncbi:MAG: Gfo/Idh/MocA family oxidoreductase [Lachnoclostridium sp.]|nr:Gfo/Idh/MocA family oxidoreductase [Lachnospira sp.]MCM1247311.1 Gfo/Idh/MocA family oxidoreductase [Lachnoclostridium sp.]MCM1534386.1 Gfo/Idh/MocA family oxidoreductase [Clostridium sp.]